MSEIRLRRAKTPLRRQPLFRQPMMSQGVITIPPVEVRHDTGLERLLLPVGLLGAGGLALAVGGALPDSVRPVSTLAAIGLLGAGVYTLIQRTTGGRPAAPGGPAGPGVTPGAPFVPAPPGAFDQVSGEIVSPADFSTVNVALGVTGTYPVRVVASNPTGETVTFSLELEAAETPAFLPFGQKGDEVYASLPAQVTLGPGQSQALDLLMPIASEAALADYIDVALTARKRRSPGESPQLLDMASFVIE